MTLIKPHDHIPLAKRIGNQAINAVVNEFYNLIQTHPSLAKPFGSVED